MTNKNVPNKCFSVRFQRLKDEWDPRTASMVLNKIHEKEFFQYIEKNGLVAVYSVNDVWYVKPAEDNDSKGIIDHMCAWMSLYNKILHASEEFMNERRNAI